MIECRVLGPVELTVNGKGPHRDLLHKKNLALLLYLARSPAQSCGREQLMVLLWPDRDEKTARHSLREAIRVIKRHVGEDVITTESDRVRLVERAVQLDTDELEDLRTQGSWQAAARLVRARGRQRPDWSGVNSWRVSACPARWTSITGSPASEWLGGMRR